MAKKPDREEPRGSVSISVRLPEELLREIDSLATEERRTRGNMVRLLLEDALKQRKQG